MKKETNTSDCYTIDGKLALPYSYFAGRVGSRFITTLRDEKKIMGVRCDTRGKVFVPPRQTCEKCMEENSEDVECRFARACCLAAEKRYEAALDEFLHIVQADRKAKGDAVKEEMVRVFSIIGQHSDQAKEYRSKLTRVLYC